MSLKRRAIEGIVVASTLVMMGTIAVTADKAVADAAAVAVGVETDLATNGTAGVVVCLDQAEEDAYNRLEVAAVNIEQLDMARVATAEEASVEEPVVELTEEQIAWQNRLMADVNEFLYVRATGDENAEIVGKLYKGAVAEIVEMGDTWTHIVSGNVDGYVCNDYCLFGQEALDYATVNFDTEAEVQTDGLRVRGSADAEGAVITAVSTGTTLTVDTNAESAEGWVAVKYGSSTGYVSAEYVTTDLALGEGVTIEEEQAAIKKAEEEAAAAKAAQVAEQNAAIAASVDEVTLLAALIQCEAGGEPYEGQLAVGAVVMNRVRSGGYPGTIYDVIYQRGQFTPAGSGKVASRIANGPKASCIQAAQEAINGVDNTGGALHFHRASSGHAGLVIGNHVFY